VNTSIQCSLHTSCVFFLFSAADSICFVETFNDRHVRESGCQQSQFSLVVIVCRRLVLFYLLTYYIFGFITSTTAVVSFMMLVSQRYYY